MSPLSKISQNKTTQAENPANDFKSFITDTFAQSHTFIELIEHHQKVLNTADPPTLNSVLNTSPNLGNISGLSKTALILLIGNFFKNLPATSPPSALFYISETEEAAEDIFRGLQFLFPNLNNILYYPAISELPGKLTLLPRVECHRRFLVEQKLSNGDSNTLTITSLRASLTKIPSPILNPKSATLRIKIGTQTSLTTLKEQLSENGYTLSTEVKQVGEYLIKSGIVDIFLPNHPYPYRIYFWDNEIEMIRPFDPITQKILPAQNESANELNIRNCHYHFPKLYEKSSVGKKTLFDKIINTVKLSSEEIVELQQKWKLAKNGQFFSWGLLNPVLEEDSIGWTSIVELANNNSQLNIFTNFTILKEAIKKVSEPYFSHQLLSPKEMFAGPDKRFYPLEHLGNYKHYNLSSWEGVEFNQFSSTELESESMNKVANFHFQIKPPHGFKNDLAKCQNYLSEELNKNKHIFLFTSNSLRAKKLADFFIDLPRAMFTKKESEHTYEVTSFAPTEESSLKTHRSSLFNIISEPFFSGMDFENLLLITDTELFRKKKKSIQVGEQSITEVLEYFTDLKSEDYVVHINHGIGQYIGLERVKTGENEKDYLKLEYQGGDKLFVPVEQMNLVQRYIGSKGKPPRLDYLGGKSWDKIKQRVRKEVESLTKELIALYRQRRDLIKTPCPPDDHLQELFESAFPYEETEDQLRAAVEIKNDLERESVMDRLLCGDVGFGKTEVAMRGIFKAVFSGRQVAVLVPTTILSIQHYQRFLERFRDFPVNIQVLNRFKSSTSKKQILSDITNGKVEIIIGTHAILSEKIHFKKLGLLVIDEEQKFGVKQKEKIKKNYPQVETLSLSATPIPRTLHMSLSSIRSISVLNTPPRNRTAIKTYVLEWDLTVLKEAITNEIARKGQVFFVHDKVSSLPTIATLLKKELPDLRIGMAHGQMAGNDLEKVMERFVAHDFDLLVCTSIIESGMDLSRVNTLIVNNANHFGLTQLYQLKGRVGRSDIQAYAYFVLPSDHVISEEAMKRLEALTTHSELGAGFKIAMSDLEIRGPGNILGAEQSGNIMAIGFDLYTRLLNESIERLQSTSATDSSSEESQDMENLNALTNHTAHSTDLIDSNDWFLGTLLELRYDGYIPHSYIPEDRQKVTVYKKIAAIETMEKISQVETEIREQYGEIIPVIDRLLRIAEIRVLANEMKLFSVKEKIDHFEITLFGKSNCNHDALIALVTKGKLLPVAANPSQFIIFIIDQDQRPLKFEEKMELLKYILNELSPTNLNN